MGDLPAIAHNLYGQPLAEFIKARDAKAAAANQDGDAQLAKNVRALRKPSVTAWVVNLLARSHPELLQELVDLGAQLRRAQASSDGARLRSLDQDRRRLMARVATESSAIAKQHGQSLGPAAAAGVDETMKAALAHADAGSAVLSGMLVAGLSAPGFGSIDPGDSAAVEPPQTSQPEDAFIRSEAARKAVSAARRETSMARTAAATARARLSGVVEQQTALEDQLVALAAQVEKVEGRLTAINEKIERIERDAERTSRAEAAALQTLEEAEAQLAHIEGQRS